MLSAIARYVRRRENVIFLESFKFANVFAVNIGNIIRYNLTTTFVIDYSFVVYHTYAVCDNRYCRREYSLSAHTRVIGDFVARNLQVHGSNKSSYCRNDIWAFVGIERKRRHYPPKYCGKCYSLIIQKEIAIKIQWPSADENYGRFARQRGTTYMGLVFNSRRRVFARQFFSRGNNSLNV